MNKIINKIKKKTNKILKLNILRIYSTVMYKVYSDEEYLKRAYKKAMGEELNLVEPQKFNEKLQVLKLKSKEKNYSRLVDKYEVREFIKETIGEKYLTKLYGVYKNTKEIDFNKLPNKFILKTTHDSGGVIICKDKNSNEWKKKLKELDVRLKQNYYYLSREYPYKNVEPRIICEELLEDKAYEIPLDFKLFCFGGRVEYIQVDFDRFIKHTRNFYNRNWELQEFSIIKAKNSKGIKKPENLEEMILLAEKISKEQPFLRVDFYSINNSLKFGEITFFPEAGFGKFNMKKYEYQLGDLIKL